MTSQFCVCPIPFHFDTYRGCTYGCTYCFARDLTRFARRNKDGKERGQTYIEGNSPEGLAKWCQKVLRGKWDLEDAASVAFRERMPVKIGATADPFPICELNERITHDCLRIFHRYDYPVQISTKNPQVFLQYANEFRKANIALTVSCIFNDDEIARKIELGAIPPSKRLEAIEELSKMGYKVTVRIHPFILPYSENIAEEYIKRIADIGAYGFMTEGLKIRVTSSQNEKAVYGRIGDTLGFDILEYFRTRGTIEGADRCYSEEDKRRMLARFTELADKYGIKFYNGDNLVDPRYGHGAECCGTDFLRNHKVWGGARRSLAQPKGLVLTEHFGNCLCNFTRGSKNSRKTIAEVCGEYNMEEDKRMRQNILGL